MSGTTVLLLSVVLSLLVGESCAQTGCTSFGRTFSIGETECVLLTPYYYEYQWATCLTDAYIRRVSDQNHICRGGAAVCWYQCQLELHDLDEGPVSDRCRCFDAETPTPDVEMPTLPPECLSPGGLDCNWYRECLELRYPCEGTGDGYAIEYAQKFCNLFSDNYNDFSPAGRQWVDGVRRCLQLQLVPSLRPFMRNTCADIKTLAFRSHSHCYLNPALGAPSICDIPCSDTWKAFWVVNGRLDGAVFTEPVATGRQMLDVILGCRFSIDCTRVGLKTLILSIPAIRTARSISGAALRVSQFIAEYLNFGDNDIGWFPYFDDEDTNDSPDNEDVQRRRRNVMTPQSTDGSIMLLLVDLQLLNISNGTSSPTDNPGRLTLDEAITAFGDAVSNGVMSRIPVMFNGTEVIYKVSSVGQCGDTLCSNNTNVTELATAPPTTTTTSAGSGTSELRSSPKNVVCTFVLLVLFTFVLK